MLVEPYWNLHRGRDEFFPHHTQILDYVINGAFFLGISCLSIDAFSPRKNLDLPASDLSGEQLPVEALRTFGADGKSYNILYQMVAKNADLPWGKHIQKTPPRIPGHMIFLTMFFRV